MKNPADLSWAFIQGYYYPKFLKVVKEMEWDERYQFLKTIYNDKNPDSIWEERSEAPIQDMMEYVARKDYTHFFYMGFTVQETGHYTVHRLMREAVSKYRRIR
jgi:hypothetical protein